MKRIIGKGMFGAVLTALFLMPFFSWISAEVMRYQDPDGLYTLGIPEGWKAEESTFLGKGVVMEPAGEGEESGPMFQLLHEAAGVVAIDVYWHTHLGRLRYDLSKVQFQGLEDHEDQSPPWYQARYSFHEGDTVRKAVVRLVMIDKRFYLMTGTAPGETFEEFDSLFTKAFESLTVEGP
jgi:hypothetical protein